MSAFLRFSSVVVVLAISSACSGGGGVINPSPLPGPTSDPQHAPETEVQHISLLDVGSVEPLVVWFTNINPPKNSPPQMGQTVSVSFTCGGPMGYTAYIGVDLMSGEYIARSVQSGNPTKVDDNYRIGGTYYPLKPRCDGFSTRSLLITIPTLKVDRAIAQVWVAKGEAKDVDLNRPPDAVFTQELY